MTIAPSLRRATSRLRQSRAYGVPNFNLRPYQEACVRTCLKTLEAGATRCGVSLPTGSGKTVVFLHLLSRMRPPSHNASATCSLITVGGIELARQTALQARKLFPECSVEIEQGQGHCASGIADITVGTYQTLIRRLPKYDPTRFKAVIVDEAHHVRAYSYQVIISHFNHDVAPNNRLNMERSTPPVPVLGFSATFGSEGDADMSAGSVFGKPVYHRGVVEMIKLNWLCGLRLTSIKTDLRLEHVPVDKEDGDFHTGFLGRTLSRPAMHSLVVKTWHEKAVQAKRKSTLIFCANTTHLRDLTDVFISRGVDARCIDHSTPHKERALILENFKRGQFPVLLNCGVLAEGIDLPNVDCLIVVRPTKSKTLLMQIVGRGLRPSPETGKRDCHIIDFLDGAADIVGIITVPSLFGLEPGVEINGEYHYIIKRYTGRPASRKQRNTVKRPGWQLAAPAAADSREYEDPFGLSGSAFSGARDLHKVTANSWVKSENGKYVLDFVDKGFLYLYPVCEAPDAEAWLAFFRSKAQPQVRHHIDSASTLEEAIRLCDRWAEAAKLSHIRTAKWRTEPVTQQQMDTIGSSTVWPSAAKILFSHPISHGNSMSAKDILTRYCTRGDVHDILVRILVSP